MNPLGAVLLAAGIAWGIPAAVMLTRAALALTIIRRHR